MDRGDERRRKKKSSGSRSGGSRGGDRRSGSGSPPKRKHKKKSRPTAEDALEAKMRAKSQREKMSSSKAEDALEAKIREKERAAAARAAAGRSPRPRPAELEEEKVEEGYSRDEYDDPYNTEMAFVADGHHSRGASRGAVQSGVPVTSSLMSAPTDAPTDADGNALFTRGGGDVRNRPPPPGQAGPVLDPLREAELEKEKNKKKVNPKFADLHETGQWGALNKWEKYAICVLTLGAIAAAVVLGIRVGRTGGSDTPPPTLSPTKAPSQSPSSSPTGAPTDTAYRETFGLELMTGASPKLTLPQTAAELQGAKTSADSTPQELAAEFVLFEDPMDLPARDPRFMERYALAVFYFQNGGCAGDWIARTNWLSVGDHCDGWRGVVCDLKGRVIELNLSRNYVTGKIPIEFAQLLELGTLDLSNNAMVGPVPAEALSMRKMFTIQLNNNMFTGEFPFEEVKKGAYILDNLWIQENTELYGAITEAYCSMNTVTLDCDNFGPQPTYPVEYENDDDEGKALTTFQLDCRADAGRYPNEYTCNFDPPEPFTRPPDAVPATAPSTTVCGTPAVGT